MKAEFHHEGQQYSAEEIKAALGFVNEEFSLRAYAEGAHIDANIDEIKKDPVFWLGVKIQKYSKKEVETWLDDLAKHIAEKAN